MQQWTAVPPACMCCLHFKGSVCRLAHEVQTDVCMRVSPADQTGPTQAQFWSVRQSADGPDLAARAYRSDQLSAVASSCLHLCSRAASQLISHLRLVSTWRTPSCVLWPPVSCQHQRGVISYSWCYSCSFRYKHRSNISESQISDNRATRWQRCFSGFMSNCWWHVAESFIHIFSSWVDSTSTDSDKHVVCLSSAGSSCQVCTPPPDQVVFIRLKPAIYHKPNKPSPHKTTSASCT